jgi:hypothetical protein
MYWNVRSTGSIPVSREISRPSPRYLPPVPTVTSTTRQERTTTAGKYTWLPNPKGHSMPALTSSRTRATAVLAALAAAAVAAVPAIAGQDDAGPIADGEKLALAGGSTADPGVPAVPLAADEVEHVANVPGSTGGHVAAEGDRLYVGSYGTGMRIFSIEDPAAPVEIGAWTPGPQGADDPGARADAVPDAAFWDDRHIVALGGTSRTSGTTQTEFIDATDPSQLELLWRFAGREDGEAHNSDIVDDRRLWLPSGGSRDNGLRIYDMRPLLGKKPAAPAQTFRGDPGKLWEASPFRGDREVGPAFTHTHDLQVYTDHPVAVPTGADHGKGQGQGRAGAPRPAPQRYELRDIVLLAEGGSYLASGDTGSVFVIDITDPANPVVLNRWMHDGADDIGGEHHPIRYFHEVQFLDADPSVMIVTDEDLHNGCDAGGVTILRVSPDLTEVTELAEWFIGTGTPAAMCSSHVFSTRGHHLFMGAYNAGLQVVDLSDPANPKKAGQHIAAGANSWGALAHGDYVYVGDFGARGLDVFRFTAGNG